MTGLKKKFLFSLIFFVLSCCSCFFVAGAWFNTNNIAKANFKNDLSFLSNSNLATLTLNGTSTYAESQDGNVKITINYAQTDEGKYVIDAEEYFNFSYAINDKSWGYDSSNDVFQSLCIRFNNFNEETLENCILIQSTTPAKRIKKIQINNYEYFYIYDANTTIKTNLIKQGSTNLDVEPISLKDDKDENGIINQDGESLKFSPQKFDPQYRGIITISAELEEVYSTLTERYVEGATSKDDKVFTKTFSQATSVQTKPTEDEDTILGTAKSPKVFANWVLKLDNYRENNNEKWMISQISGEESGTLTLNGIGIDSVSRFRKLTLTYARKFKDLDNLGTQLFDYYYVITDVKGFGDISLDAQWSNVYPVRMYDNMKDVENNRLKDRTDAFGNKIDGYGAFFGGKVLNEFSIQSKAKTELFFDNTGNAFYKSSDYKNGANCATSTAGGRTFKYYFARYGYEINEWSLTFKVSGSNYGLKYENNVLTYGTDYDGIISAENMKRLDNSDVEHSLTKLLDDLLIKTASECVVSLTVNSWSPAKIKLVDKEGTSVLKGVNNPLKYNSNYKTTDQKSEGQTHVCWQPESDLTQYIAKQGVWDFKTISYNKFTFDNTNYILKVKPVFTNNIYKVDLYGAEYYNSSNQEYKLYKDSVYKFAGYPTNSSAELNITSFGVSIDNGENNVAEEFSSNLKTHVQAYNKALKLKSGTVNNDNDVSAWLNKVFVDNATTILDNSATIENGTNASFSIYLIHGQSLGGKNIPIFDSQTKQNILWEENSDLTYTTATDSKKRYKGYKTSLFDENTHQGIFDNEKVSPILTNSEKWEYREGNNTLEAYYYQKYYLLDAKNITKGSLSNNGYALIKIDYENDKTFYLVQTVVESGKFVGRIYLLNSNTNIGNFVLKNLTSKSMLTENEGKIKVFVGSAIYVYAFDQSRDSASASSGSFDGMVGYKFMQITYSINDDCYVDSSNKQPLFDSPYAYDNTNLSGPVLEIGEDKTLNINLKNGSTINMFVEFEPIIYTLSIEIDHEYAGSLGIKRNYLAEETRIIKKTFNNLSVVEDLVINYYSIVGFKLQSNAFVYGSKVLTGYDDKNPTQQARVKIDGTWLRQNFYKSLSDYSTTNTDLGKITVQTEAIEFKHYLKAKDDTDNGLVFEKEIGSFSFTDSAKGELMSFGRLMSYDSDIQYYLDINGTKYAVLNSQPWYLNNDNTTKYGFDEYKFVLDETPEKIYEIRTEHLSKMLNYNTGVIVPEEDRTIYTLVQVRKINKLTLRVEKADGDKDSNLSERSTTVVPTGVKSELINNSKTITIGSKAGIYSSYYAIKDSTEYAVVMYSYCGLGYSLNKDSSTFNSNYYTGVQYKIGTGDGNYADTIEFVTENDTDLTIQFIPKAYRLNIVYKLNGSVVDFDKVENLVELDSNNTKLDITYTTSVNDLFLYSKYRFGCRLKDGVSDYNLSIFKNNNIVGETIDGYLTFASELNDTDYEVGKLELVVDIKEKDNSKVIVNYALKNTSQARKNDDFGTVKIVVDGIVIDSNEAKIIVGKSFAIDISGLAEGYVYCGLSHNNGVFDTNYLPENGIIAITNSYNPGTTADAGDSGIYTIYIRKIETTLTLDSSISNLSELERTTAYALSKNGRYQTLSQLLIGDSFALRAIEQEKEVLKNFYYLKDGNKLFLTDDGTENGTPKQNVTVDSDMFEASEKVIQNGEEKASLTIYLDIKVKHKLNIELPDESQLEKYGIKLDGKVKNMTMLNDYQDGTYFVAGTELGASFATDKPNKVKLGYKLFENGILTESEDGLDKIDLSMILKDNSINRYAENDLRLVVELQAQSFGVEINNRIYNTLDQLDNLTPEGTDITSPWQTEDIEYNQTSSVCLVLNQKAEIDGKTLTTSCLKTVTITSAEQRAIRFNLDENGNVIDVYVENDEGDFVITSSSLSQLGFKLDIVEAEGITGLKLTYKTENKLTLTADYISYKLISQF